MELVPYVRAWFSTKDGRSVVGSGRCRLLRAIHELGSLSAAAEQLEISYRKAWDDLRKIEGRVGCKLIEKSRGGTGGGRTELTAEGTRLLRLYEQLAAKIEANAVQTYNELTTHGKDNDES